MVKSPSRRPSTTARSSPNATACSARASLDPITDWECLCGKYKRMKHRGVICDKCGVEVTLSKVRRERLGHIELARPARTSGSSRACRRASATCSTSRCASSKRFSTSSRYVVVDPGDAPVKEREVIKDENRFRELDQQYRPSGFKAMMGAEAIKELLKRVEIDELVDRASRAHEDRDLAAEEAQVSPSASRSLKPSASPTTSRSG